MKRITMGILAALAIAALAGCGGLRARGGGEVPENVERVDTYVVDREEEAVAAVPDSAAPAPPETVVSGVPETETAVDVSEEEPETIAVAEAAEPPAPVPPKTEAETAPPAPPADEIAAVPAPEKEMPPPVKAEPAPSASMETSYIPGFRVQVLASRDPEHARVFAEELRSSVSEKVYVEYLAPYYKVRIGDCATRNDAGRLLRRVREAGFSEAWIAETLVVKRAGKRP